MPTALTTLRARHRLLLVAAPIVAFLWFSGESLPELFEKPSSAVHDHHEGSRQSLSTEDVAASHQDESEDPFRQTMSAADHEILGSWGYNIFGRNWQREYTRDYKCILRRENGSVAWIYDFKVVDSRTVEVFLERKGVWRPQRLLEDGRLDVGEGMIAERVSSPP